MSTDEFLPKVNSQNSRQVMGVTEATIRENGLSRGTVSGIGLGLLVACLLICGLGSVVCDFELSPRLRILCPAASPTPPDGTTITPSPTPTDTPTPTTPGGTTITPSDTPTPTPTTPVVPPTTAVPTTPMPCTALTPNPALKDAAVQLALSLADHFYRNYGVLINASGAVPFNAICLGTDSNQLLGMIAPVSDENQRYKGREVEGVFNINDSRLVIETMILLNKGTMQYSTLPLGSYMLACNLQRLDDCLAISLQGEEFQIRPESIEIRNDLPVTSPPSVAYEEGSIRKCFNVARRKICIRVF